MSGAVEASIDSFFGDESPQPNEKEDTNIESARSFEPSQSNSARSSEPSQSNSARSRSDSVSSNSSVSSTSSTSSTESAASTARSSYSSDSEATSEKEIIPTGLNNEKTEVDTHRTENTETYTVDHNSATQDVQVEVAKSPVIENNTEIQEDTPELKPQENSDEDLTDISSIASPRPEMPQKKEIHFSDAKFIPSQEELSKNDKSDIKVSVQSRPKSAHPRNRTRKPSTGSVNSSINSSFDFGKINTTEIKKHRNRLLYNTSKSSKDLNHLLEAVLILDQKGAQRPKNPDPFPPRAVGSARGSRKSSFTSSERQREIQRENERLLRELTKQRKRPTSAVSVASVRSNISRHSNMSGLSATSTAEMRRTQNCRASPIARNYHSKINRTKEAKRIDEENLALLRRLQNVRASPSIQMSRQQVSAPPRIRPKSMRPKIVNTWTDGW
jgi:hypothetical protein